MADVWTIAVPAFVLGVLLGAGAMWLALVVALATEGERG